MADHDKTEKATPKRKEESRKKGQVAKSMDLTGSLVLLAALLGLVSLAPTVMAALQGDMHDTLVMAAKPDSVSKANLAALLGAHAKTILICVAPVAGLCMIGGLVSNVAQVRLMLTPQALKPDPKRLDPLKGAKNIFGPNALFEGAKAITKLAVVGAIAAAAVAPKLDELAALVGLPPAELLPTLAHEILGIAWRAGLAYLLIGIVDYAYQYRRHDKQLRMSKQELKEEFKGQGLPAEVKGALRRRQVSAARARMMDAVPEADVVVTNPTHYAVALKYDGAKLAPEVVAKGKDLLAAQIRRIADENGVPIVPDPPLARSLHASVEVGSAIPEDFYAAVAQLLAFVYRMAGSRR